MKVALLLCIFMMGMIVHASGQLTENDAIEVYYLPNMNTQLLPLIKAHNSTINEKGMILDSSENIIIILPHLTSAFGLDSNLLRSLYNEMDDLGKIVSSGLYITIISLPKNDPHLYYYLRDEKCRIWQFDSGKNRFWIVSSFNLFEQSQKKKFEFKELSPRPFYDSDLISRTEFYWYPDRLLQVTEINDK